MNTSPAKLTLMTTDDNQLIEIDADLYERLLALDRRHKEKDVDDQIIDTSPENMVEFALETFLGPALALFQEDP